MLVRLCERIRHCQRHSGECPGGTACDRLHGRIHGRRRGVRKQKQQGAVWRGSLGGDSGGHQGGRDRGRNCQVQELLRRTVHHGHDPHKRGGLHRRGGLYRGLPCARELGIRRRAVYIHRGLHTPFADPIRAGVAGYLVRQVPAFDATPWRCAMQRCFLCKKRTSISCLFFLNGTPSGARTLDTLIKSQVLYQLS